MMVVQIKKPANMTLAVWFTELRLWLDENKCQPTSFILSGRVKDTLLFDATFSENTQARLFASKFAKYMPEIRRATNSKRAEIRYTDLPISDERARREEDSP